LLKYLNKESGTVPWFDMQELADISKAYLEAVDRDIILSGHDVSSGGIIQALLEMSFGSGIGFAVDLSRVSGARTLEKMFAEGGERIIAEVSPQMKDAFLDTFKNISVTELGKTLKDHISVVDNEMQVIDGTVDEFRESWVNGLNKYI
nr:AIR synthase-related protein [Thermoplasmatales archaeon]